MNIRTITAKYYQVKYLSDKELKLFIKEANRTIQFLVDFDKPLFALQITHLRYVVNTMSGFLEERKRHREIA